MEERELGGFEKGKARDQIQGWDFLHCKDFRRFGQLLPVRDESKTEEEGASE
jgi:hypothetical protein